MPNQSLLLDRALLGAAVVLTCILFTEQAADPVNVIKLSAASLCALALCATGAYRALRYRVVRLPPWTTMIVIGALTAAFAMAALAAPVTSTAIFGTYGRNSGLIAYGTGLVLAIAALRSVSTQHARLPLGAIVLAGSFTATYGLLQHLGIDRVPWNNPFNPIIAALGNPNFASGYLGIVSAVSAGAAAWRGWSHAWRWVSGATAVLSVTVAFLSTSVQGPIAAAGGLAFTGGILALGLDRRPRRLCLAGLGLAGGLGTAALILGAAYRAGPAAPLFADTGSQARVFYWDAAIRMFSERPVIGVGLDHYGHFWRGARSVESVVSLGGPSFSDAAHSVPLQMFAQGGLVLGLAYLTFVSLVLFKLLAAAWRVEDMGERALLAALGGGWAAYQVQSAVSIDQVPLIVIHFTLAGCLLAITTTGRELRLSGAVPARPVGKARRLAAPARRSFAPGDLAALGLLATGLIFLAWQALAPLRANVAVADGDRALRAGDGNAALAAYERATRHLPGESTYWLRQGALFDKVEQPRLARRAYEEAARRNTYDLAALGRVAELAEQAGDLAEARQALRRAGRVDPTSPETLLAMATFELRHSGASTARALLESALERLPQQADVWAALGDARAVTGDAVGARDAYAQALALEPENATAQAGLQKLDL